MFLQILDIENWSSRCLWTSMWLLGTELRSSLLVIRSHWLGPWHLGYADWSGRPRVLPISASPTLGLHWCITPPRFSVLILGLNSDAHICGKCFSDWAIAPALWVWRGNLEVHGRGKGKNSKVGPYDTSLIFLYSDSSAGYLFLKSDFREVWVFRFLKEELYWIWSCLYQCQVHPVGCMCGAELRVSAAF